MGSGILRAIGDSQRPFYFLVVSALTNVVLDLVFCSCVQNGSFRCCDRNCRCSDAFGRTCSHRTPSVQKNCCRLSLKKLRIHRSMFAKNSESRHSRRSSNGCYGIFECFRAIIINSFGEDCMGGWTAYVKIDQFLFLPDAEHFARCDNICRAESGH